MKELLQKPLAIAVLLASLVQPVRAANAVILWDIFGFDPETVAIHPGDRVTWWNVESLDFVLSVDGFFPVLLEPFDNVSADFNTPGVYNFSSDWGDSGVVVVTYPPSLVITNPVNDATFAAPATFLLQVDAADDMGLSHVEFYKDSGLGMELIDYDFEAPYAAGLTNVPAGTYVLTAVANDGYFSTTDAITITVSDVAPLITLTNARVFGSEFRMDADGLTPGKSHVLQYSTDLTSWTSLSTNVAGGSLETVSTPRIGWGRFYRLIQLP